MYKRQQSYGEESLKNEKKAIEEGRITEEIAKKVNNEKPTAITTEAINKAADVAMRANKAQKRLEKIKIQRTIFPAITTLLSSYTKKKSFGMDSFFAQDAKSFFRTNDLPQTIDDYFSITDSITRSSITEKDVSLFLDKESFEAFADVAKRAQNLFVLEKKTEIADFICRLAEVVFSILSFINEQTCFLLLQGRCICNV